MRQSSDAAKLGGEIRSRIAHLPAPNTAAVRNVRREFSRRIGDTACGTIVELALLLVDEETDLFRFVAYEIVKHHKVTFASLSADDLLKLGQGLNSWSSVDCFGLYLSGPMWMQKRLSDNTVISWARSQDRWWRRAALVTTVTLSRSGDASDIQRVLRICTLVAGDRDDMVVKALSWALRELAKKHPEEARGFVAEHKKVLPSRVIREVQNKLTTGLKTPRPVQSARSRSRTPIK
jgi:3-methyladenine DNA glycosylase AlkD